MRAALSDEKALRKRWNAAKRRGERKFLVEGGAMTLALRRFTTYHADTPDSFRRVSNEKLAGGESITGGASPTDVRTPKSTFDALLADPICEGTR